MIAVLGASGNVGSKVSELLLEQHQDVRVFGRSAEKLAPLARRGAEVVVGDAVSPGDLHVLFEGAVAALVVLPDNVGDPNYVSNRSAMGRNIAGALRDQRIGHTVFASSIGAHREAGGGPVNGLHELEELLFALEDANVLSLRQGWHMENLLASIPMVQEQKMNGTAIKGDLRFPMTATVDVAERAVQRLLRRDFTGCSAEMVLGPEDRTMTEATLALGEALGIEDLPYVEFPPEGVRTALQSIGMSEEFASNLVEMQVALNKGWLTEEVERTAENTTPTRLEAFLSSALAR